jgi:hypothetical protein
MSELTIQFVPHAEIMNMSSADRIKHLITIVKKDKIALVEGQLKKEEEAKLIADTMGAINQKFKGIELAVIYPQNLSLTWVQKLRSTLANVLLGQKSGLTIVGPATVVQEIKQDPEKIQLFTVDNKIKKK